MKSTQIVEKVLTENAESPQVIYIFVRKIQIFDVFDDLFQTGHDGVAVFYRILPGKIHQRSRVFVLQTVFQNSPASWSAHRDL